MAPYFAFLHHMAAFTVFAALVVELVLIRGELTLSNARKIQLADAAYGIAAGCIIVIGVLRVIYFEKGPGYYLHSVPFWIKMSAFFLVGLLSILPTIEFVSWSKSLKAGRLPEIASNRTKLIRRLIHFELAGVALIILAAALMAKGVGYVG